MFSWLLPFKKPQVNTSSHLAKLEYEPNHLLSQVVADDNLEAALVWLRESSSKQDNSDVWNYSRDWEDNKKSLQQRILSGQFEFQVVSEVENAAGEFMEIRCAEDRLLIRAISQVLTPIFDANIAAECVHLVGRGGTQQAVKDVHAQLLSQPKAQVMKSDVKGYYANVDHRILLDQFATLLPNETELQRLLWMFLQRTVERGGNYRDITKGLPLGASISPQLGALYLSPLDVLFSTDAKHFYRRYMDDWVIFCKNSWDLRKTVKKVYTVLHALRVEVAPDKTYIGKASKGFDFLGKRILPIGILPSASALSRLQKNTVRLYEQGATRKRIELYWKRWLGWVCITAGIVSVPVSAENCITFPTSGDTCHCESPVGQTASGIGSYAVLSGAGSDGAFLWSNVTNAGFCLDEDDTTCTEPAPNSLATGDVLYLKNTSPNATDYYTCSITLGTQMVGSTYTPSSGPNPPPVSAPIGFSAMSYMIWVIFIMMAYIVFPTRRDRCNNVKTSKP
ncbi:reverse transcriptase/maturase family protein [Candidatus Halobeggiatoa sp. HSG11]|nr:reverse transcriptase/maturase family protein [Candidatus Halobeggiatoa sp. HSG11]